MSLPVDKLKALKFFLLEFSLCRRASKRELHVLAGKLNWACRLVYGGHSFFRCIIDQMNLLKSKNAKFKLNKDFYDDLSWWLSFLEVFNGKCMFLEKCPTTDLQTDASKFAAGAFYRGDWLYHAFIFDSPSVRD